MSVLIVDAEPASRYGLANVLKEHRIFSLCGEAGTLAEARRLCAEQKPRLVIVDVAMNGGEGFVFVREVARLAKGARVVAFTALVDGLSVQRALQAGAFSYVWRRDSLGLISMALRAAAEDEVYLSPGVEKVLVREIASGRMAVTNGKGRVLSERERQVFDLVGKGCATRDVASTLSVSVKTIESHLLHIREKLNVCSLADLRRGAIERAGEPEQTSPVKAPRRRSHGIM